MEIQKCKGARVYAALVKGKKGENKITWAVHYKNESVWCNDWDEVLNTLKKITPVMLHGEEYKTWELGKGGWRKNNKELEETDNI